MKDLIAKFDPNENFIRDYILSRKEGYFDSKCFDKLKKRHEILRDCNNMRIGHGQWKSKIAVPLVKERAIFRRAALTANFRNDPLITLEGINDTPSENAINMSTVEAMNLKHTDYRRKCLRPVIKTCAEVGAAVVYAAYYENNTPTIKTTIDSYGLDQRVQVSRRIQQVRHYLIHILNYFQDAYEADPEESAWQGHIRRWQLSELVDRAKNYKSAYVMDNLEEVIKQVRDGAIHDDRYHSDNEDQDEEKHEVDLIHFWGTLPIKGNEESTTVYYAEIAGDKIIRFQSDVWDEGIKPYAVFAYDKRLDYWWGNADSEFVLPHENYMNLLLAITADNALQNTQRIRFFQKGSLNIADINNRATNNGFVGVDLPINQSMRDLFFETHNQETSLQSFEAMMREMKESAQRVSSRPDLSRPASQGGYNNKTLGGAQLIQGQSDMLESDYMESFSYGLQQQAKIDVTILKQMLAGNIRIRPDVNQASRVLQKPEILGDFDYIIKTSLQANNLFAAQDIESKITKLINLANTGRPEFQNMNIVKLARHMIRLLDLPEDVDEILPEQAAQQNPNYVQSALPAPAGAPQGGALAAVA
jgi:hypothetical protein